MPVSAKLEALQQAMIRYLQDGNPAVTALVAEQPPLSVADRLSIYASAYRIRLCQALETDHELLATYLGDDRFAELAEAYIRQHPSQVTSLRHFGEALPSFLLTESPYRQLPVLAELAAFERLMLDVFDAPDAGRADITDLQAVPPEAWPGMHVRFHPSVQIHTTQTNAVSVWQALKAGETPPDAGTGCTNRWLLWRGTDQLTQFRSLSAGEHRVLDAAICGIDFAGLCESLTADLPAATISETVLQYLLGWIDAGLVSRFEQYRQRPLATAVPSP